MQRIIALAIMFFVLFLMFTRDGTADPFVFWDKIWIPEWKPVLLPIYVATVMLCYIFTNFFLQKAGKRIPVIYQHIALWFGSYFFFRYVVSPPLPFFLVGTYMTIVTLTQFLLLTATDANLRDFLRPVDRLLMAETQGWKIGRAVSFLAVPALIGWGAFNVFVPKFSEPIELRTVHPAPPQSITVHGQKIELQQQLNPFRDLYGMCWYEANPFIPETFSSASSTCAQTEESVKGKPDEAAKKTEAVMASIKDGGQVFFGTAGCFFCHGDNLDGKGPFAFAFNPIPANFVDPGTIAQLQETFVLWRVSKGGPGLAKEGFPWASAMPPWEEHLTMDEIWKVILFEYWHTGFFPRTWD